MRQQQPLTSVTDLQSNPSVAYTLWRSTSISFSLPAGGHDVCLRALLMLQTTHARVADGIDGIELAVHARIQTNARIHADIYTCILDHPQASPPNTHTHTRAHSVHVLEKAARRV